MIFQVLFDKIYNLSGYIKNFVKSDYYYLIKIYKMLIFANMFYFII